MHKRPATIDLSTITGRFEAVLGVAAVGLALQLTSLWQHVCRSLIIMQLMLLHSVKLNLMKWAHRRAALAAL